MHKVIIKKEDLPPISVDDTGYNLRVRLISQDRNRSSFWTPLITIEVPAVDSIQYVIKKESIGTKTLNVIWDDTQNNKEYDIYVKWYMSPGDVDATWIYKGSTFSNNYSLIDPDAHSYQVSVQTITYPKMYTSRYSLFTSPVTNI
jgi:hypothetical protein